MMHSYLVTGGMGFVGSHLVEQLVKDGHYVTILDNLSNGILANIKSVESKVRCLLMNVQHKSLISDNSYDGIFHLATAPRSSSLTNPIQDIETNCKGMINMLELARKCGAKLVFTSNSGIYGNMIDKPIDESFSNDPTTPYDADKLVSEYYAKIYYRIHGVRSAVVRFATVYGERQRVNESLNWRPVVATFIKNILNEETISINGDGNQTRDLIYVKDAVQGLVKAMNSTVDNADVCLISTDTETSVNQILKKIESIVGTKATVKFTEPLKGDIRRMRYSYRKAELTIGYRPTYTLEHGIENMINYGLEEKQLSNKIPT